MTRRSRGKVDPLEHEIELGLNPGAFIPDRACLSFVSDLDEIAAKIGQLTRTDPARAMVLSETFLAGCYEKVEELDDSSGCFGQFVGDLFCGWIKARQAAGADPDETATRLLAWMDDDPYGFCYDLEKDAAKAFDKVGLAAFEKQIRVRFDAAAKAKPAAEGSSRDRPEGIRRRWGEVLRTLYVEQKKIAAYVSLAEETGLTAQDCCTIATLLVTRRKSDEALAWVERGINLENKTPHGSMAGHDLAQLKRELLRKLGRGNEALEAAWADFREHPGKYTYDDLMKFVPKAERSKWRENAIEAAKGADLEGLSHYATEPAAKKLQKTHPDVAARLWRAQGMRIVNAKKSKYYDAALSNFESAKRCYARAGLAAEWDRVVNRVRAEHHRKTGFMSGFEGLVAGSGPSDEPSFLERARARWGGRHGRSES